MKIHRIKRNYRYIICEIKGEFYLIDLYDYWWITIFIPCCIWFFPHKASLIDKKELKKFNISDSSKKIDYFALGGISLLLSRPIASMIQSPIYLYNFSGNDSLSHSIIIMILFVVCLIVFMKFNHLGNNVPNIKIRIYPSNVKASIMGGIGYLVMYGMFILVITMPFQTNGDSFLLSIPYIMASILCIFFLIEFSHILMTNTNYGPYDYKFEEE